MKLEVIAKNLRDVIRINKTDADRIEFCSNLVVGGLTPRRWVIWLAAKISKIPINVMLRPNSESFNYSDKDFAKMLKDAAFLEKTKVNGVVFGVLNQKNEIDIARMKQIIAKIPSKQKVFHKAFDQVNDFDKSLKELKELNVDAVLTAAGQNINENLALLKQLTETNQITIIGGGGVTFNNATMIAEVVNDLHVGTAARKNNSWKGAIDLVKVNRLKHLVQ